ncbi:uncharacterized protein ARMOST_12404 [Armillaria ostoyae]|uniref:Uncharacterized protein n=1 Tax=Armillaria ostoyae TaxID=47428 RepID=A0A284RJU7_ARMOS|nr:uncharacterized protein ARMOST_12404 [Armillaria ostoyae]
MSPTTIDDRDSSVSRIGTWTDGGTPHEYDSTVSSSKSDGDHLMVTFTGTQIAVYGTYDYSSSGVITSYAVDGGNATRVTHSSGSGDTYNEMFWESDPLELQQHELVVTMVHVNTGYGDLEGTVWFDYFNVYNETTSTSASTLTGSATLSSSPSSSTANPSDAAASLAASDSSSANIGAIVGGIVGGVFVFLVVAVVFVWYRSRQKRRDVHTRAIGDPPPPFPGSNGPRPPLLTSGFAEPFIPTRQIPVFPVVSYRDSARDSVDTSSFTEPIFAGPTSSMSSKLSHHQTVLSYVPAAPGSSTAPMSSSSASRFAGDSVAEMKQRQGEAVAGYFEPIQHVDSGVRTRPQPEDDLPPVYSAS